MARQYFDIVTVKGTILFDEGTDLPGLNAAGEVLRAVPFTDAFTRES